MTKWRGQEVSYAVFSRKDDTYSLIGKDRQLLAELGSREFRMLANRANLEVRDGRYRSSNAKDQRRSDGKSGNPGRDDPFLTTIDPGAQSATAIAATSQRAGLTTAVYHRMMMEAQAKFRADMMRALSMPSGLLPVIVEIPRPSLKRDGIVAGEIIGHRCWLLESGLLRSVYQSDVWRPGHVLQGRELGDWDQRGIHAWKDPTSRDYNKYIRSYLNRDRYDPFTDLVAGQSNSRPAMVTGTIFMWGDVVEHERGWRAEFARVRSLDWFYPDETMMGRERDILRTLCTLYGVPRA